MLVEISAVHTSLQEALHGSKESNKKGVLSNAYLPSAVRVGQMLQLFYTVGLSWTRSTQCVDFISNWLWYLCYFSSGWAVTEQSTKGKNSRSLLLHPWECLLYETFHILGGVGPEHTNPSLSQPCWKALYGRLAGAASSIQEQSHFASKQLSMTSVMTWKLWRPCCNQTKHLNVKILLDTIVQTLLLYHLSFSKTTWICVWQECGVLY